MYNLGDVTYKSLKFKIGDLVKITNGSINSISDDYESSGDFKDFTLQAKDVILTVIRFTRDEGNDRELVIVQHGDIESPSGYYEEELVLFKQPQWDN